VITYTTKVLIPLDLVMKRVLDLYRLPVLDTMKHNSKNQPATKVERPEIEYPCTWVYKVIGRDYTLLKEVIVSACAPQDVKICHSNTSSGGKYHSLNAELNINDEATRLAIYDALKNSPGVKFVL